MPLNPGAYNALGFLCVIDKNFAYITVILI